MFNKNLTMFWQYVLVVNQILTNYNNLIYNKIES